MECICRLWTKPSTWICFTTGHAQRKRFQTPILGSIMVHQGPWAVPESFFSSFLVVSHFCCSFVCFWTKSPNAKPKSKIHKQTYKITPPKGMKRSLENMLFWWFCHCRCLCLSLDFPSRPKTPPKNETVPRFVSFKLFFLSNYYVVFSAVHWISHHVPERLKKNCESSP